MQALEVVGVIFLTVYHHLHLAPALTWAAVEVIRRWVAEALVVVVVVAVVTETPRVVWQLHLLLFFLPLPPTSAVGEVRLHRVITSLWGMRRLGLVGEALPMAVVDGVNEVVEADEVEVVAIVGTAVPREDQFGERLAAK
jgi:hypothetical protein